MAKSAMKAKVLGAKDLVHDVGDDAAYLAIVDLGSYAKDLPDWDYFSLTKKIAADMSAGRIVAWGCPEGPLTVRLTTKTAGPKRANAKYVSTLVTKGQLCLVGYTSLTMCAQFEDQRFPQSGDLLFSIAPGTYTVTVYRLFAHEAGEQFPAEPLPASDHYEVTFAPGGTAIAHATVPWAPPID